MLIGTFFVCCCFFFLTECKDEKSTFTGIMDVNMEQIFLIELKRIQDEFHKQDRMLEYDMSEMKNQLDSQRQMIGRLGQVNTISSSETTESTNDTPSVPKNRFRALGCQGEKLALSCTDQRTISVTAAYFGKYTFSCDEGCCAPSPYLDCSEAVSVAEPCDWVVAKVLCDDKTDCELQYSGRPISGCDRYIVTADYMQIYYDCLPEHVNEIVGFTAHATKDRSYTTSETIVFDDIQSNFGRYYNGQTSSFICPHSGVYLFTINFNAAKNVDMHIEIVRDNVVLSGAMAYMQTGLDIISYSHADAFVIVECNAGQVVWARAAHSGNMYAPERYSQFSGYLLQRHA